MISQTAEYALRAMVYLTEVEVNPTPTDVIARNTHAPFGYLVKIMARLSRAGLVTAQRGRNGGFVLGRPAHEISMFDVLEVADSHTRELKCPANDETCLLYLHLRGGCQKSLDYWQSTPLSMLTHPHQPHPLPPP
jgi:Rrf2 family protein